jgi:hypothetical protein
MPKTEKSRRKFLKNRVMKKLLIILLGPIAILSMSAKNATTVVAPGSDYPALKKIVPKTVDRGRINPVPLFTNFAVPSFEDITVYRIQLRIFTCNKEDAGTDDGVYVQMNEGDKRFYLNRSKDDFRQGSGDTYDVWSEKIKRIKDIKFLKIGLRGDDGVCIAKIELSLNDNASPVFSKSFSGGKSIDNSQSFTIPGNELRNHSGWALTPAHRNLVNPPRKISKSWILSLVECSIGNQVNHISGFSWGSKVKWGPNTLFGPGVEMKFINNRTLHFDLDLQRKLRGPNPEADIDFDLVFSCNNGVIKTEIKNVKFGTNWTGELQKFIREKGSVLVGSAFGTATGSTVVGTAGGAALAKFLSFDIKLDLPGQNVSSSCRTINVLPGGDIMLQL